MSRTDPFWYYRTHITGTFPDRSECDYTVRSRNYSSPHSAVQSIKSKIGVYRSRHGRLFDMSLVEEGNTLTMDVQYRKVVGGGSGIPATIHVTFTVEGRNHERKEDGEEEGQPDL